jgi:hypothetical protein
MIDSNRTSTSSTGGLVIEGLVYIQSISMTTAATYSTVLVQSHHAADLNLGSLGSIDTLGLEILVFTIIAGMVRADMDAVIIYMIVVMYILHCLRVQNRIIHYQSHMMFMVDR